MLVLFINKLIGGIDVKGWTTIMILILIVSSFQMIALGIIGEYVWRTLDAIRNRPIYIIEEIVDTNRKI
ncbi:MAG: hypothetical protein IPM95_11205 [Sphingobacteriales bacterium]|nr:hypothetical protein [Sphingobacteriales bacterium]